MIITGVYNILRLKYSWVDVYHRSEASMLSKFMHAYIRRYSPKQQFREWSAFLKNKLQCSIIRHSMYAHINVYCVYVIYLIEIFIMTSLFPLHQMKLYISIHISVQTYACIHIKKVSIKNSHWLYTLRYTHFYVQCHAHSTMSCT